MIADPVQYQRRRDERDDVPLPLRSLHFGPDGEGSVMFLMYPPDDLVLVINGWPCWTVRSPGGSPVNSRPSRKIIDSRTVSSSAT